MRFKDTDKASLIKKGSKRVLITGASGFIGSGLFAQLQDIDPLGVDIDLKSGYKSKNLLEADLRDAHRVKTIFEEYSPDIVFHFAALTSPKRNEENVELARESHLKITNNIVNNIKESTHIVFLSTDKIFDGSDHCPDEEAKANPLYIYGHLKLECEHIIQRRLKKFHIFRLPIVHSLGDYDAGGAPISFIDKAIADIKSAKQVTIFDNVYRCFLKRQELLNVFKIIMNDTHYGVYHLGSRMMSYYDRLRYLCEENQISYEGKLIPITGEALPLIQNLNTSKFKKTFGYMFS